VNPAGVVALVAGGASGLGRATADMLVANGATVVVLDLERGLERGGIGDELNPVAGDVRDEDAVAAAIARAESLGDFRICVNCAGIGDPALTARDGVPLALDRFVRVVEVNLIGTFNVARLAAASMQRSLEPVDGERGVIVNTASVAAYEGQIGQISYAASKGGIASMSLVLARDLARSLIRCVTIAPGIFDTPLLGELSEEVRQALGSSVPHPARLGRPEEYAQLVLQIVENQMLNGEVIRLDGALRMPPR
jgi:NAD(P)-dependent dehydrogenase (short-subunit alcohol dehydrogenase family)